MAIVEIAVAKINTVTSAIALISFSIGFSAGMFYGGFHEPPSFTLIHPDSADATLGTTPTLSSSSAAETPFPGSWIGTPSVSVLCRTYGGRALEFYNTFVVGYMLFWPHTKWVNSDVVVVLDDEGAMDHRMGTVLANIPPYPRVFYEQRMNNTFCSQWRREGYSRQQYSNFYSDNYTQSDYIGIVDSDSFFVTPVVPEDLFVDGKPRIYGYNGCCTGWLDSIPQVIGGEQIGEFMVVIGFPVLIKREHFAHIREHITKHMNTSTFEEAFHLICDNFNERYSQFDILVHYLWHYKRDEYSWHIKDSIGSGHPAFSNRSSNLEAVLEMNRPIIGLMKNGKHLEFPNLIFELVYDYVCLGSDQRAGTCRKFEDGDVSKLTKANLFVDRTVQSGKWIERGLPSGIPGRRERPWSADNVSWVAVYDAHVQSIISRHQNAWNWK